MDFNVLSLDEQTKGNVSFRYLEHLSVNAISSVIPVGLCNVDQNDIHRHIFVVVKQVV